MIEIIFLWQKVAYWYLLSFHQVWERPYLWWSVPIGFCVLPYVIGQILTYSIALWEIFPEMVHFPIRKAAELVYLQ